MGPLRLVCLVWDISERLFYGIEAKGKQGYSVLEAVREKAGGLLPIRPGLSINWISASYF